MTEYFMSKIPVKKIIVIKDERFVPVNHKDPVEVRPVSLAALFARHEQTDLSNHTLYIYPNPPHDVRTGIFRVYLSEK